jgi:hypothetical protein
MNLFGGKSSAPAPAPTPSLDEARQRVDSLKRTSQMRGRAAAMLTQSAPQAPTAQRATTGN